MTTNTQALKAAAANPATPLKPQSAQDLKGLLNSPNIMRRIEEVLGKKATNFCASLLQIQRSNALLQQAEPMSVISAAIIAATLDLPLNNSLGFAYIVPFRNSKTGTQEAQFQIGYKGFIQLAMRSGQIKRLVATEIYADQIISRNPIKGYEFDFDVQPKKNEKPKGYYAYMELINGFIAEAYMSEEDIKAHASKYSQTYKKGYGVWKDNFNEMAVKTVLKKLLTKYAPMSVEMQTATIADQGIIHDIPQNGDIINYSDIVDHADRQLPETSAEPLDPETFEKLVNDVSTGEISFEDALAKYPNLSQEQHDTLESL